jgi:hypothetical protein
MLPIIRYSDAPMKSQARLEPIYCYLDFCVVHIYLRLGFQNVVCNVEFVRVLERKHILNVFYAFAKYAAAAHNEIHL